jgi:hypothetical protein
MLTAVMTQQNASEEEKALFLQTAEETAQNLETAKFLLSTSIIDDAIRSYTTFLPDATSPSLSQESNFLEQAINAHEKEKEKVNPEAKELNSLGFWRGNLLEQKLLQAKIENAIQRAQLQTAAGQPDQALKILVASLRDSSAVFENYLEVRLRDGTTRHRRNAMCGLICGVGILGPLEFVVSSCRTSDLPHRRGEARFAQGYALTPRNATQRNATQRNATQRNAHKRVHAEREKPQEIRDDEGEEEIGWIITNSKVSDFLSKGDILLGQAMQALRHRHDSVRSSPPAHRSCCSRTSLT